MKVIMFPGQGSQYKGMGKELFSKYRSKTQLASEILGYDIEELCVKDPNRLLAKTQYTQPALFVVNSFKYYEQQGQQNPDFFIGHSLGEYNALHAAGAFDFETGIEFVKKRGELMAAASGGGMAAILGQDADQVRKYIDTWGYTTIDIANYNTPSQIVISGPADAIESICKDFEAKKIRAVVLFVTAPFHSRYMQPASLEFSTFLETYEFSELQVPVISNSTAKPYTDNQLINLLGAQIANPVKWIDTIRYLMGKGIEMYQEIGSEILGKMVKEIRNNCTPIYESTTKISSKTNTSSYIEEEKVIKGFLPENLGSKVFRDTYGIRCSYLAGAMYKGIASKELIVRMGKSGLMGFLGTGGLSLSRIEEDLQFIQQELSNGQSYGMNLLHNIVNQTLEWDTVLLFLKYKVYHIEASAFMQITLPLVYYRIKGIRKESSGKLVCDHKIIAKISHPKVAEAFMKPPPERYVKRLLEQGKITKEQAEWAKEIPMSYDICVEADSGGHTDGGVALVLLPSIQSLRKDIVGTYTYPEPISIGLAGGIGTPQAVACAFVMGADFVLTGSINQCTVESGTSDAVKDLLQDINVQDTSYAPAGDMFEIGAKIQVLKKGVLFSARANKLFTLYQQYDSLDKIPENIKIRLETTYFKKTIEAVWEETKNYLNEKGQSKEVDEAVKNPKKKMALVFRWYFGYTNRLAFEGDLQEKVNFQIHTGPALGAFNQWVKGTKLQNWRNRHVDEIADKIMQEAAIILNKQQSTFSHT